VVRTQRPDRCDGALDLPQQRKYLMNVIFAHNVLELLSFFGI
jgi:hypothetical protein